MVNGMRALDEAAIGQLFDRARTHSAWSDQEVTLDTLRMVYDHARWGPTSANTNPARFAFVVSPEAKERLRPHLHAGNVDKTMSAPCTVIVASDPHFYRYLPELVPGRGEMARSKFEADEALRHDTITRNTALQGAYLIMSARMLGLDCGPMSGFDRRGVDESFFGTSGWRSDFLINLGYGIAEKLYPRWPRLAFDQAATFL